MIRCLFALAILVAASAPALAQDMPLSQILIDGEGWKKVAEPGGRGPGRMVATHSPGGSTVFRWTPESGRFLEAKQAGTPQPFAAYAPLRTKRGGLFFVAGPPQDEKRPAGSAGAFLHDRPSSAHPRSQPLVGACASPCGRWPWGPWPRGPMRRLSASKVFCCAGVSCA